MWWRLFVPVWRFFDREGLRPELWVLERNEWRRLNERPPLKWYALVFNPEFNQFHALNNLLERLIQELQTQKPEELVSYRLVEDLAEGRPFKVLARGETVLMMEPGR
jgi:hypothetical protein